MEKKFDLISSMMKRLGISPRVFISQCIKENRLSLDCSVTDGTSVIKFKSSTRDKCSHDNEEESDEKEVSIETIKEHSDVAPFTDKETLEKMFFTPISSEDCDEFELNENTQEKVKCGMFVYAKGPKFIISKNPMHSKLMQNNSLQFKGIMFANKEDVFLVIRFGEERCGYSRAVKKLINGYKILSSSDCETLFVYLDTVYEAFKKLHINLRRVDRIFCLDTSDNFKGVPCIFSLKQGSLISNSDKSLSAGSLQVLTIKKIKK